MKNTLPPGITRELIEELKSKRPEGDVKQVDLSDGDGTEITVLMVRPNRTEIDMFERNLSDPARSYGILEKACLKSHHAQVQANDKIYTAMLEACMELLPYSKPNLHVPDLQNLPSGISLEMIEALKAEGRTDIRIAHLQKNESGDTLPVLVCAPKRKAITDHEKWDSINPKKAKQYVIDSCLQSHQEEVKGNDWLWFAAYSAGVMLKPKGASVIKNC